MQRKDGRAGNGIPPTPPLFLPESLRLSGQARGGPKQFLPPSGFHSEGNPLTSGSEAPARWRCCAGGFRCQEKRPPGVAWRPRINSRPGNLNGTWVHPVPQVQIVDPLHLLISPSHLDHSTPEDFAVLVLLCSFDLCRLQRFKKYLTFCG